MELLFSKLQAFKLLPLALGVFRIPEIPKQLFGENLSGRSEIVLKKDSTMGVLPGFFLIVESYINN